jgi:hypothetical protein
MIGMMTPAATLGVGLLVVSVLALDMASGMIC